MAATTAVKERPVIFSGPMVRAIIEGRKTQTRLVVNPQSAILTDEMARSLGVRPPDHQNAPVIKCPCGEVGDRLIVKEGLKLLSRERGDGAEFCLEYRADGKQIQDIHGSRYGNVNSLWCGQGKRSVTNISPKNMPRWASRFTIEITGLRVQRLHDIGKDGRQAKDVLAEGITAAEIERQREWFHADDSPALAFSHAWESINGKKHPWKSNPWVWAITFKNVSH